MKKIIAFLLIVAVLLVFITACPTEPPIADPLATHIYASGYIESSAGYRGAVYWKDGAATWLTDGSTYDATAYTVFVSGTDVYAAGYSGSTNTAVYWKNGTIVTLGDGTHVSIANSIFVSGSDVYVAGIEKNDSGNWAAVYWENGIKTLLSADDTTTRAFATSIVVVGTDVYVAGYENPDEVGGFYDVAKYWENGTGVSLTGGSTHAQATDIFVSGTDVYVSGYEKDANNIRVAKYWKNGTESALTDPATNGNKDGRGLSIGVSGSDVYVVGYENADPDGDTVYHNVYKYWKNGTGTQLGSDNNNSYELNAGYEGALFLDGSDVYIAGRDINYTDSIYEAKYWKNDTAVLLGSGGKSSAAFSVYVIVE